MSESPSADNSKRVCWCLESLTDNGKHLRRVPIYPLPFRIGRRPGLPLTIPSASVSKEHAEIYEEGDTLHLRDLSSTNGTFVNRERVTGVALREGDILHFADLEFRLGRREEEVTDVDGDSEGGPRTVALGRVDLPHQFVEGTQELGELLREGRVRPVLQPIVKLPNGTVEAYEVLGRGTHRALPESPGPLFRIAACIGVEAELSRLFREKALEQLGRRTDLSSLFLNTHPAELVQPGFAQSVRQIREMAPHLKLTLEIHESALADARSISSLRGRLSEWNMSLAYDDFGSGERLLELAELPPDYLKFDICFVHGIDRAPPSKRRLLTALVAAARDLGVLTVAEGIETEGEAGVCVQMGFHYAQGYLFGRPFALEGS
ncbi:MAG: EAL domain-containing protein [Acidobacteriota bacterium]